MFNHLIKAGINHSKMLMNTAKGSPHRSANNVRKQVSVDSRTKIYLETALINYANSGNCDIMYIPRCVGKVIICGIKACSRYNVLSAAVPGPKAPKAGRSPARDRQTEGSTTRRFAINTCKVPHICRTTFHTKGESSNT